MKLFSPKTTDSKCYVLYSVGFDRKLTKELYEYILYFFSEMKVDIKFSGFYDEKYDDRYGRLERIRIEMESRKWYEIVHFALDDEDIRKSKRKVAIEFNISRVFLITLVVNNDVSFSIGEFLPGLDMLFKVAYGFGYATNGGEWAAAYANGDWQHTKEVPDVVRVSKEVLQRWNEKSTAIVSGLIRDVFCENILSAAHLLFPVNGQTLKEYIDEQHGELVRACGSLFMWNISKSSLDPVRKDLYRSGIVI